MKSDRRRTGVAGQPPAADRETRRQILDAAEALFIEHGFKGVSMKDVAEAVAITPAALYYHFPAGKEELFAETIRHFLQSMLERAFLAVDPAATFRERLTQVTRNLLAIPVDRLMTLFHDAREYVKPAPPAFAIGIAAEFGRRMAATFADAIAAGEIGDAIPPELLATMHQGMCMALLNRRRFVGEPISYGEGEQARMVVSALLDGVGRAPPS